MALLSWKENYSVNIAEIDNQHKKLIEMINKLHDGLITGSARDALSEVLFDLVDYATTHFYTEERLFDQYNYPDSLMHKQQHASFVEQVINIQTKYHSGEPVLTMELMNFLRDWLNNHIIGSDKNYSVYLNSKGVN